MSKKILRLSSNQVLQQISNCSQLTNKPSVEPATCTQANSQYSPLGLEKPCGLFNPIEPYFEDIENTSKEDQLMMDILGIPDFVYDESPLIYNNKDIENEVFNENMNPADLNNHVFEQPKLPVKKISKFSKKVKDLNLKINIPSKQVITSYGSAESIKKPSLSDSDMKPIEVSPVTEKMYFQFIDSIPPAQLELPTEAAPSINYDLLDQFGTQENFEKLIRGFPSAQVTKLTDPFLNKDQLDHDYSISQKKRKFSEDSVFEDSMTNDSFGSSSVFADSLNAEKSKNHRKRGIYRADDITNEEERLNYLERRKKNNISSKISRANKKKSYTDMDYKCAELEKSNIRLSGKIEELDKLNKVIKDFLVDKFNPQSHLKL